jgi:uncharacterized membrane protein HdeD (DUF308 family)
MDPRIDPSPAWWRGPARLGGGWLVGIGAVLAALGVLAVILPFAASLTTTLVIGWILLVGGVVQAVHSIQQHEAPGFGWSLLGALVRIVAGVLVIARPLAGTLVLTAVLATYFLVIGVAKIARGVELRATPTRGLLVFDGIVSLVLGILVWSGFPATATWIIGLFVGVEMIMAGISAVGLGLALRSHAPRA